MNTTKTPTAFVMLTKGKTVTFYDYQTGFKLDSKFQGIARLYIGGTVDATMRTTIDADGVRAWYPVKDRQSGSIIPELCWLVATLLLAMLFIVPTVRHYDGQIETRLNQLISLERK